MAERRAEVLQPLKCLITDQTALDNDYCFTFEPGDESLNALLTFIQLERACCTFLRFVLTVEPNASGIYLEMTGPEGTKTFIEAEMELTPAP
jgi:hypothetical protein